MTRWIIACAVMTLGLLLSNCSNPQETEGSTYSAPPIHFQASPVSAAVHFDNIYAVERRCSELTGRYAQACARGLNIWLPNPCPFKDEHWMLWLQCHEIGHVNGWEH